jgi:hypothetical protein
MQMGEETIVTTKVDGSYDKTYIPDPLFLDHHFTVCDNKIDTLMIQMAGENRRCGEMVLLCSHAHQKSRRTLRKRNEHDYEQAIR